MVGVGQIWAGLSGRGGWSLCSAPQCSWPHAVACVPVPRRQLLPWGSLTMAGSSRRRWIPTGSSGRVLLHGASFVRVIAYMGSYPDDVRYVQAAERVAAHGLGLDVVLALPRGAAQAAVTPAAFAAWRAQLAGRLAATGAPLRVSCERAGPESRGSRLLRSDDGRARRAPGGIHHDHEARPPARSPVADRAAGHPSQWANPRDATAHRVGQAPLEDGADPAFDLVVEDQLDDHRRPRLPLDPARASRSRVSARCCAGCPGRGPGIEVGAGETSPCWGTEVFMRELARVGIPSIDRWAHHPYALTSDGRTPCGRRDSNPHGQGHRHLKPARLPVPPRPQRGQRTPRVARDRPAG